MVLHRPCQLHQSSVWETACPEDFLVCGFAALCARTLERAAISAIAQESDVIAGTRVLFNGAIVGLFKTLYEILGACDGTRATVDKIQATAPT